jgi:hypothetical protein
MYTAHLKWNPLVHKKELFWNAAKKDAAVSGCSADEYLAELSKKLHAFKQSYLVADREIVTANVIEEIDNEDPGKLHILLGGKSTGKTKVLQSIVNCQELPAWRITLYGRLRQRQG